MSLPTSARYRVDLAGYMRTCDQNYWRLLRLMPALESGGSESDRCWEFTSDNKMIIRIRVLESFRYTSTLEICVSHGFPVWIPSPTMQLRLYHDAATAEPLSYQGHRQIPAKNRLPNSRMYHQDEKRQINEFLAQWLDWCLKPSTRTRATDILCID